MRLKNEALVGLVVIMGIITALLGAVWLSGRSWGQSLDPEEVIDR